MAAVLGSCLGLLLSRGALAPAEVKERVPLADSVCWSSQSAVRQFGSLAVCSLPFLRLAVWKISPFRRLIPRGSFPNSSATRFGDLATFRRFFPRFFPKRGTKRRTEGDCSLHIETSEPPLGADRAIVSASHSASRVHTISSHRPGGTRRLRTPWTRPDPRRF